jgi:hypothetical protein
MVRSRLSGSMSTKDIILTVVILLSVTGLFQLSELVFAGTTHLLVGL